MDRTGRWFRVEALDKATHLPPMAEGQGVASVATGACAAFRLADGGIAEALDQVRRVAGRQPVSVQGEGRVVGKHDPRTLPALPEHLA